MICFGALDGRKGILPLGGFNVVDLEILSWINTLRISLSIHGALVYRCCFHWLLIGAKETPIGSLRSVESLRITPISRPKWEYGFLWPILWWQNKGIWFRAGQLNDQKTSVSESPIWLWDWLEKHIHRLSMIELLWSTFWSNCYAAYTEHVLIELLWSANCLWNVLYRYAMW